MGYRLEYARLQRKASEAIALCCVLGVCRRESSNYLSNCLVFGIEDAYNHITTDVMSTSQ